jgi:hypothetical protein
MGQKHYTSSRVWEGFLRITFVFLHLLAVSLQVLDVDTLFTTYKQLQLQACEAVLVYKISWDDGMELHQ